MCVICLVEPGSAVAEGPGGIGKYKKLEMEKKEQFFMSYLKLFPSVCHGKLL